MTRREIADVFKSVLGKGACVAAAADEVHHCRIGGGVTIDEIIELGVIPRFVEFLQTHEDPILQVSSSLLTISARGRLWAALSCDMPPHV